VGSESVGVRRGLGSAVIFDSAEKPQECFDRLSMNGKILNNFEPSSVRPEALEG
jgi:hypothetical protein